ncbi:fatty acyl-AMP ligase [Nonomuraea sp. 10N515B]|uniref:fatty acyl-AMP ligase n=1 Tax=Nonomuraea sp. 10N515B TaxID=3457422 RepID=UPI003FCC5038
MRTTHGAVAELAQLDGDRPAATFIDHRARLADGRRGRATLTLTYGELDARARATAAVLRRRCAPGGRAAIMCPHGLEYIVAFLACLNAGVVAVPLHAPELFRDHVRLRAIVADCAPGAVLTTSGAATAVRAALGADDLLLVDEVPVAEGHDLRRADVDPDEVAYLQYTSGSTGNPTGVRITHANLAAANHQITAHFPESSTVVSWVPFFHDFGLVCGIATPLSAGSHTVHISPMTFVQDPYRWLEAISEFRADWSVAPTFSLTQCVRRVSDERKRDLDLSSLKVLTIAAEPIRPEAVESFVAAFAGCGLSPSAPTPSYGLAEATLPVTASPVGRQAKTVTVDRAALAAGQVRASHDGVRLVSCGTPSQGVSIMIDGDEVGEILVRGPNVASYADDGWLHTGDLGFVHEGELYVAGRIKDLVIVRGRNHYPDDIETTVLATSPDLLSTAAAFSTDGSIDGEGDGERLVLVVEAERELLTDDEAARKAAAESARQAVTREHGLDVHEVLLVRRGRIPRTTSGKLRRGACREQYLRGEFHSSIPEGDRL